MKEEIQVGRSAIRIRVDNGKYENTQNKGEQSEHNDVINIKGQRKRQRS